MQCPDFASWLNTPDRVQWILATVQWPLRAGADRREDYRGSRAHAHLQAARARRVQEQASPQAGLENNRPDQPRQPVHTSPSSTLLRPVAYKNPRARTQLPEL